MPLPLPLSGIRRVSTSPASPAARSTMIGLVDLFVSGLLISNGLAILNEERFLAKIGWGYEESLQQPMSIKKQVINLLHAVRLIFTIPMMVLNVVVIVLKLLIG